MVVAVVAIVLGVEVVVVVSVLLLLVVVVYSNNSTIIHSIYLENLPKANKPIAGKLVPVYDTRFKNTKYGEIK